MTEGASIGGGWVSPHLIIERPGPPALPLFLRPWLSKKNLCMCTTLPGEGIHINGCQYLRYVHYLGGLGSIHERMPLLVLHHLGELGCSWLDAILVVHYLGGLALGTFMNECHYLPLMSVSKGVCMLPTMHSLTLKLSLQENMLYVHVINYEVCF